MTPYIGEIRMFGGNFAPVGWAKCDGALLGVHQYEALFSILGNVYGGDGRTSFGLPDLRGRTPIHYGQPVGGSSYALGEKGGAESVAVTSAQLPSHSHSFNADDAVADTTTPTNSVLVAEFPADQNFNPFSTTAPNVAMAAEAVSATGSGDVHPNIQPYTVVTFIISLLGEYPSRQ